MPIAKSIDHAVQSNGLSTLRPLAQTMPGKVLLTVSASLFVALCAHVSVPLPFTPVPLTFSDLAVLLVGLALGPELAFAALALYLAEGAAGLPVFNPNPVGLPGLAHLLGHTGGYLFAYPFAAAITGFLARRLSMHTSRFLAGFAACAIATTLIMTSGTIWLGLWLHASARTALMLGALPFLPGQAVKVVAAAGIFASFARWRKA